MEARPLAIAHHIGRAFVAPWGSRDAARLNREDTAAATLGNNLSSGWVGDCQDRQRRRRLRVDSGGSPIARRPGLGRAGIAEGLAHRRAS
jgi:hypothetical protein